MDSFQGSSVVVRSSPSGVWFGALQDWDQTTGTAVLSGARRAWHWSGACSCSELALTGPSGGTICAPVPRIIVRDCCEVILATDVAVEAWNSVEAWKATE